MKMYVHLWYLTKFFLEWEMFQIILKLLNKQMGKCSRAHFNKHIRYIKTKAPSQHMPCIFWKLGMSMDL